MIRRKVLRFFWVLFFFALSLCAIQLLLYASPTPLTGASISSIHTLFTTSIKPIFAFAALFICLIILVRVPRYRALPPRRLAFEVRPIRSP